LKNVCSFSPTSTDKILKESSVIFFLISLRYASEEEERRKNELFARNLTFPLLFLAFTLRCVMTASKLHSQ